MTQTFTPRGWICPVCGAGCAPTLKQCPCASPVVTIPISPGSTVAKDYGTQLLFQPAPSTAPLMNNPIGGDS